MMRKTINPSAAFRWLAVVCFCHPIGCTDADVSQSPDSRPTETRTSRAALSTSSTTFINELHYDNAGADSGEAFEIAGPASTPLDGYSVVLYNGNGGAPYATIALSGVIPNQGGGVGTLDFAHAGIQNGAPDGLALVDPSDQVLQFLSYEGAFAAVGGPADGMTSVDIGLAEDGDTPVGMSLQLTGTGQYYEDFTWTLTSATFGAPNVGQTFAGGSGDAAPILLSTLPTDGAIVAADSILELTFSEAVDIGADALDLQCSGGFKPFVISGGPEVFELTPDAPFAAGDECTLRVVAEHITDQDDVDPPDQMSFDVEIDFSVPTPATIAEVQGEGHLSPLEGVVVDVRGIVTVAQAFGFYMQSADPDRNRATSDGLFVYTGSNTGVAPGDEVSVLGPVVEFRPGCNGCPPSNSGYNNLTITEISTPNSVEVLSSGNPIPEATIIGKGGRKPPKRIIDDDTTGSVENPLETTFDPRKDGIDFYESLEGMLVAVNDAVAVSPTTGFGEIAIVGDNAERAGLMTPRGGIVVRKRDFNPERILIDDDIIPNEPLVHVGARFVEPVVGVIGYSFGNFKLNNSEPLVVADAEALDREVFEGGPATECALDLATFNVENLRPADSAEKFDALAQIVVEHLLSPDILTLEEVQDNSGPTNDGVVDGTQTLQMLTQAIVDAGGPSYSYAEIAPEDGQDGGQPGGNIRVAFLYNSARGVNLVERPGATATTANSVFVDGKKPQLEFSPGRINPTSAAFDNSRKPLAAQFEFRGESVFVVANHWNSKGGDQPLFGRLQPPELQSEVQRVAQATEVASFVSDILAVDKRSRVVVMGDLNDFHFSAPLQILEDAGLKNTMKRLPKEERYTYIFDGNSQALDHIMISPKAGRGDAFLFDVVHVNSEFHDQVSDHDPSVVRLAFD